MSKSLLILNLEEGGSRASLRPVKKLWKTAHSEKTSVFLWQSEIEPAVSQSLYY